MKQKTLANTIKISGKGFYSGKKRELIVKPSEVNTGIVFVSDGVEIPADIDFLYDEVLHTTSLARKGSEVRMTEHILSAFYGLQIDNAIIYVKGFEIPFLNSVNAKDYVEAFLAAGIVEQYKDVKPIRITKEMRFSYEKSWAILLPSNSNTLTIKAEIGFPHPIGKQKMKFILSPQNYIDQICWARNFLRTDINQQLIDGITFWDYKRSEIAILPANPKDSPIPCFDANKWISYPHTFDEPVRHKILDLIGDICLLGRRLWADVHIYFPGHVFNQKLTKFIRSNLEM